MITSPEKKAAKAKPTVSAMDFACLYADFNIFSSIHVIAFYLYVDANIFLISAYMMRNAAQIPENRLETVCIIQLGIMEPLAHFSLTYPINIGNVKTKLIRQSF